MKLPGLVCWACGSWSADRLDKPGGGDQAYRVCFTCGWMLYRVRPVCLGPRGDALVQVYEAAVSGSPAGKRFAPDLLGYKLRRVQGQRLSGMIGARCRCPTCRPESAGVLHPA